MINLHIDDLEQRWGKFKKLKNAYGNCPMNFIKTPHDDLFYSNMLFDVVPLNSYETIYNKIQNCEMPNFLKDIYSITNGLHFFCDSLIIMGDVKNYSRDDLYRPAEYFPTCYNAFQRFRDYYKAKTGKDYLPK